MSKVLKIIVICVVLASVLVLLGFVESLRSSAHCEEILILNKSEKDVLLVENSDVELAINAVNNPVVGHPLNQIDTRFIESQVTLLPYVKWSRAYKTIDKRVVVELHEREIIARLIDRNGKSAYLDIDGYILPRSKDAVLRIPVISGDFTLPYQDLEFGISIQSSQNLKVFTPVYEYAMSLNESSFWRAQLQHTQVDRDGNFTAYPQVGNHQILFGTTDRIEEKLENLGIFYQQGMDESRWNKYKQINLKYNDQVVCTKK